jgi:hypothetical protein
MQYKILFLCTVFVSLPLNGYADPFEDHVKSIGGTVSRANGGWLIVCTPRTVDAVGDVSTEAECLLEKTDFLAIVNVTENGIELQGTRQQELCRNPAGKIAVDGRSINNLPLKKQIKALLHGQLFARNTEGSWPHCHWNVEQTSLDGFQAAYIKMLEQWSNMLKIKKRVGKPVVQNQ